MQIPQNDVSDVISELNLDFLGEQGEINQKLLKQILEETTLNFEKNKLDYLAIVSIGPRNFRRDRELNELREKLKSMARMINFMESLID